jgi:integrase
LYQFWSGVCVVSQSKPVTDLETPPSGNAMKKPKTARERVKITASTINAALKMAATNAASKKSGSKEKAPIYEIGDLITPGLCIRVHATTASWSLRCRIKDGSKAAKDTPQNTITIGPLSALRDVDYVRKIAEKGKARAALGENPKAFFTAAIAADAVAQAEAIDRRTKGEEWTWDELVNRYLQGIENDRRINTHRSYKSALRHWSTHGLRGKLLSQITPDDLRGVRDKLTELRKIRQFTSTMQQVKYALAWATDQKGSGLIYNPAEMVKTTPRQKSVGLNEAISDMSKDAALNNRKSNRVLEERELGLLLWEAERVLRPEHRFALIIELYTAQRRYTVASALKAGFVRDRGYGMIWSLHPGQLKTKREHALPLCETVQDAVKGALLFAKPGLPWLFPQIRKAKKGDLGNGHMSEKSVNEALALLQAPGMPLHSDRPFSPHSLRHTFVTLASRTLKFPEAQRALVTHDAEGRKSVHEKIYNADQKLPAKHELLEAWANYLDGLKAKYDPSKAEQRARDQVMDERLEYENNQSAALAELLKHEAEKEERLRLGLDDHEQPV